MGNSILILILISASLTCLNAKIVRHRFSISYISGSPDGVFTEMILGINGQFPGPTIHADIGDTLEIDIVNNIQHGNQNASIHWHGLHQNGSIYEDGTNMITQCPLKNGQEQRYTIPLHQGGTFWYHSHVMSQYTEGLWGVLIIHDKTEEDAYPYDDEIIITLGDWYHFTAKQNEEWLLSNAAFGGQPMPHSGLINGEGRYHCDFALRDKRFCDPALQMRPVFHVQRNKNYRVRVINTSAYASFNFTIDGHKLETIEVDSTMVVKPVVADIVSMSSGQRYSFLVRTNRSDDQNIDRFLIRVYLRMDTLFVSGLYTNINHYPQAVMTNMTGVLAYSDEQRPPTVTLEPFSYLDVDPLPTEANSLRFLDESQLTPLDGYTAPSYFDKELVLDTHFYDQANGLRRAGFNERPFFLPEHEPLLWTLLDGRPIPESVYPIEIDYMNVIQVVINNLSPSTPHPLHLHGHDFWVMGAGKIMDGKYDPSIHNLTLTGARRDTIFLQAFSWVVMRFVADNSGVWTFHCHIDWHMLSGMSMVFIEARERALQEIKITDEARRVCDIWE